MEASFRRWHSAIKCNTPVVSTKDRDSRNIDEKKISTSSCKLMVLGYDQFGIIICEGARYPLDTHSAPRIRRADE
ncbi:hypothetical protein NC653_018895 [Populus alba x Populus x berolinensis]|uniref:Uncharacterized protein n=1 Tax=Populus alba x Populus x berolinensis TaxID=444605 RepID=A0AAD6QHH4_9ROSI|nr:hypothetical protein NC653_018895 [Populus alba x Populus x berolinensis]